MKTYYKIHIMYPCPLTDGHIKEIDEYLPENLKKRIVCDESWNQVGSIVLSVDDSGNPELDELTEFLLSLDGTDCQPFFGYPEDDFSNAVTDESVKEIWDLLDSCQVGGTAC